MIKNFVDKYGRDSFRTICKLFVEEVSNEKIASKFGVTRQRVHQWQKAFVTNTVCLKPASLSEIEKSD